MNRSVLTLMVSTLLIWNSGKSAAGQSAAQELLGVPAQSTNLGPIHTTGSEMLYRELLSPDDPSHYFASLTAYGEQGRVRCLSFGPIEEPRRKSLEEDTTILEHLLNKAIPAQVQRNALGVSVLQSTGAKSPLYVEGAGLFLFRHVAQPVAPLSQDEPSEPSKDEPETSEWERARQELAQGDPRSAALFRRYLLARQVDPKLNYASRASMAYDEGVYREFDQVISGALRQVGNFRELKPADFVTVIVYGPAANPGEQTVAAWRVKVSDGISGQEIPDSQIDRQQYVQRTAAGD
jgi:hypothetical protein